MPDHLEIAYMLKNQNKISLPILPIKKIVLLPETITPIIVGKKKSLDAVKSAILKNNRCIICLLEKEDADTKYPEPDDLYEIGTVCVISQVLKLPDQTLRVLINAQFKIKIKDICSEDFYHSQYRLIDDSVKTNLSLDKNQDIQILIDDLKDVLKQYAGMQKGNLNNEFFNQLDSYGFADQILYLALLNIDLDTYQKQRIFSIEDIEVALFDLISVIHDKIEYLKLKKSLDIKVLKKINKMQREHYLNEQLKTIYQELGQGSDEQSDFITFRDKLAKLPLPEETRAKADAELSKLTKISTNSPEYYVSYNYLNWILDIPWEEPKNSKVDIKKAAGILDNDHYGLEKVKDRILEYLAVMQFNVKSKAQILCFVGPPGVGKTSLGKSIAKALKREFVRLSVGGISDESEIRGHRRTYIGALPGIIIQSLKKAKTKNTLIMIDEIDKLSRDYKGDPASALLEVLDPEQNNSFRDHFLDFGYDLSNVFFIATANNLATIPYALRDRMEVIHLSSYSEYEKVKICKNHLIPKKDIEFCVGKKINFNFTEEVLSQVIRGYTAEAGVRELERQLNAIYRKTIKNYLTVKKVSKINITKKYLEEILGMPRYSDKQIINKDLVGVSYGLAWTPIGGEVLAIEVLKYPGNGKLLMTGNIGKVMNESAKAAQSLIKKYHKKWNIPLDVFRKYDLHIHIPEGAVPKDGPSAGLTLTMAIVSCLSDRPYNHSYTMTGEISLTGRVLPVGGISEKIIAAQRYGFKNVILPEANKKEWIELKPEAKENLEFIFTKDVNSVVDLVLNTPKKKSKQDKQAE
ncbi:MAG: endopeptidase La [Candidatus Cloacimonetes bacterium]|nr:endopeptidase La [Candidatus Cloacimonadota bacterium]